jgi:AAA15 family ATPase/GTPase
MLTRLKVSGFKNLIDVDVRFGPFTCIAGANGVGKSNLFDAIRFLSALSSLPLLEAARSVREGRTADARSCFIASATVTRIGCRSRRR